MRAEGEQKPAETDPMVCPKVIHLLIPTRCPEILANELDAFECLGKVWFSVAQPMEDVHDDTRRGVGGTGARTSR